MLPPKRLCHLYHGLITLLTACTKHERKAVNSVNTPLGSSHDARRNHLGFVLQLAAVLRLCHYACADTSVQPSAGEVVLMPKITMVNQMPCDLSPYLSPQGGAAQPALGSSISTTIAY
ncbi:hypothetical protein HPB48_022286 [Haemaphysalis longicornis]|uniref:Uncharacterized protein n=1 Tax=Haemaphysalis longicornis TaxID=44386 RepID=A0A9J6GXE1_HAELO|nr:hypothetical protein HPB48_022286 [Haemaphysalis longicornis]